MKVMVVGSGGREYSIGLALKKDPNVTELFFAPGNGATSRLGRNVSYRNYEELAAYAKENGVDLTVVGPETALVEGIVDCFRTRGLVIFGASKAAARLEGSKIFMKNFLSRYAIPTARYIETSDVKQANDFIDTLALPIVVKADGLCAGKGVIIAKSYDEAKEAVSDMLSGKSFGDAGRGVVVEEFLDGYELSVFVVCDGKDYKILPAAQDHKRLLDNDEGPNTGGMGAYAPTPLIDATLYKKVEERVVKPTLLGMQQENTPFEGVLFIGLMIVKNEPIVLEYNVRFGDPECEILMPLLKTPASELFYKAATGNLKNLTIEFLDRFAVAVVMASENYPYSSSKPSEILIDQNAHSELEHTHISYAGVSEEDGKLYATGGRVLLCVGVGESIKEARDRAYLLCGQVHFAGKQFRNDIAYQALRQ
ncbi:MULTISPECIES: phosphoribosylamine--glycine ligase [unclassified Sulfurospirillum]|jgi:phosphoribosylamine--glycine ligase|uniref:phosphoribosylamine--glycine ligase n=1 Tax=unclassified Sulfurospirillum TaxID=2618290 RepID=UPI000543D1C9|nr:MULTISPECIES: phosphoribosylamine--glycine ligase [unclassified Sulfurospirillum]KHG35147.1 MAG: phosphoribosylamine--glycine ligase [Sulfurospirillum sp. MES]MCP3651881.1 phosphoribosylamine--glycine ligase [Sulfurospirillum sp. DNRA8]MCR1810728.1 phosphoribosylamine--glycine ligase [Sulfurospirillum sp. DNRA8]